MANQFKRRPGAETLNGPIIEGHSALVSFGGVQAIVTCPTKAMLDDMLEVMQQEWRPATHTLIGQPPWYQNETRAYDLGDMLRGVDGGPRTRRRASLAPP